MPPKPKTQSEKWPWMQFYPGDFDRDTSNLSLTATGFWIRLLCDMHAKGRTGELRGTTDELARIARCLPAEASDALTELKTREVADVTERNAIVTVICRRMSREHKSRSGNTERKRRQRMSRACPASVSPHISEVIYHIPLNPPEGDGEREPNRKPDISPNPEPAAGPLPASAEPWVDPLAGHPELQDLYDELLHDLAAAHHGGLRVNPMGADIETVREWRWALAALHEVDGHPIETICAVCQWLLARSHPEAVKSIEFVHRPGDLRNAKKIAKGEPSLFHRLWEKWKRANGVVDHGSLSDAEKAALEESERWLEKERQREAARRPRLNV